jgi:hypothetical protein
LPSPATPATGSVIWILMGIAYCRCERIKPFFLTASGGSP